MSAEYITIYRDSSGNLQVSNTTQASLKVPVRYTTQELAFENKSSEIPIEAIYVAKLQERTTSNTWLDPS